MAKKIVLNEPEKNIQSIPALTPEAREQQLIALAMDVAEKRLLNGTASSQEITHFLKLGTIRAQAELEKLKLDNELIKAKTNAINNSENSEKLYSEAIKAFQVYSGSNKDEVL